MSEVAVRDAYQPDRVMQRSGGVYERDVIDGWVQVMSDVAKLADYIAETDFVPKSLRCKPAAIAACILTGRELGIGPMQSLKSIYMVQGVPSLSAEYKRARALAAGHEISIDETSSTRCIIRGRRSGTDRWVSITWTMDMAKRAKLSGKDIWQAYPQRMLQARASGELCDLLFPDALLGLATTEVLEDGGILSVESGEMVDAASGELATGTTAAAIEPAKPKTAQRRQRPTAAAPASGSAQAPQSPQAQGPASAATAPSGDSLPPLPGEDEGPTTSGASSSAGAPGSGSQTGNGGQSQSSPSGSDLSPADPGSITPPQLAKLAIQFTETGYARTERTEKLAAAAAIAGRPLESSKDLSLHEASAVIDTLIGVARIATLRGGTPREVLEHLLSDVRAVALAEFSRLTITSGEGIASYAGQLLNISQPPSLDSLAAPVATRLAVLLAQCTDRAGLDALLEDGTVPGGQ